MKKLLILMLISIFMLYGGMVKAESESDLPSNYHEMVKFRWGVHDWDYYYEDIIDIEMYQGSDEGYRDDESLVYHYWSPYFEDEYWESWYIFNDNKKLVANQLTFIGTISETSDFVGVAMNTVYRRLEEWKDNDFSVIDYKDINNTCLIYIFIDGKFTDDGKSIYYVTENLDDVSKLFKEKITMEGGESWYRKEGLSLSLRYKDDRTVKSFAMTHNKNGEAVIIHSNFDIKSDLYQDIYKYEMEKTEKVISYMKRNNYNTKKIVETKEGEELFNRLKRLKSNPEERPSIIERFIQFISNIFSF
ncbi:MAG: hypothetical protein ACOC56_06950 [Atribacterota bacterium]